MNSKRIVCYFHVQQSMKCISHWEEEKNTITDMNYIHIL